MNPNQSNGNSQKVSSLRNLLCRVNIPLIFENFRQVDPRAFEFRQISREHRRCNSSCNRNCNSYRGYRCRCSSCVQTHTHTHTNTHAEIAAKEGASSSHQFDDTTTAKGTEAATDFDVLTATDFDGHAATDTVAATDEEAATAATTSVRESIGTRMGAV